VPLANFTCGTQASRELQIVARVSYGCTPSSFCCRALQMAGADTWKVPSVSLFNESGSLLFLLRQGDVADLRRRFADCLIAVRESDVLVCRHALDWLKNSCAHKNR
jgi:hypothetical protein